MKSAFQTPLGEPVETRIAFLCRGGLHEGMGHVSRSAAVATALNELGVKTLIVVMGDPGAAAILADEQLDHNLVREGREAVAAVEKFAPDAVVFDLIWLDENWFAEINRKHRTASISPIFNLQTQVDASFSRTKYDPSSEVLSDPVRHRRGLEYTIITPHCRPIPHSSYVNGLYEEPLSIGVAMGGSDAPNKTLSILRLLRAAPMSLLFWVMLGEGYAHSYETLVQSVREDRRHEIILVKATRSMWTVLERCSLLICAGGVTTYEAAYAGLPSLNVLERQEDEFLLRELVETGCVLSLTSTTPNFSAELLTHLTRLHGDRDELFLMHRRCRNNLRVNGTRTVAEGLLDLARDAER